MADWQVILLAWGAIIGLLVGVPALLGSLYVLFRWWQYKISLPEERNRS